jgi:putative endonuclease
MRRYYVYIMASKSRVLYIGITNDIHRRVWEHKHNSTPDHWQTPHPPPCIL